MWISGIMHPRASSRSTLIPVRAQSHLIPPATVGPKLCGTTSSSNSDARLIQICKRIQKITMKRPLIILLSLVTLELYLPAQTLSNYQATVNSQAPSFYFTLDGGSMTDATGHGVTLIPNASISYVSTILDAW